MYIYICVCNDPKKHTRVVLNYVILMSLSRSRYARMLRVNNEDYSIKRLLNHKSFNIDQEIRVVDIYRFTY